MRTFKTNFFMRYAAVQRISDVELLSAAARRETGSCDFELGHGLTKYRFPRPARGRSLSYCSVLATQREARTLFLYGFPRNRPDDLTTREILAYRDLATAFFELSENAIAQLTASRKIIEVRHDQEISQHRA